MPSALAEAIRTSLPPGFTLPEPFVAVFDWMEANNHVGRDAHGVPYGQFQPIGAPADCCAFHPDIAPEMFRYWTGNPDPAVAARLAIIMRTGGDGSHAAIWRDDEGRQRFVHLGSGSGSTLACVITDDPLDMLRLFAIGYSELCWPEVYGMTPAKAAEAYDDEPAPAPSAYARFLTERFGVAIPAKASEIIHSIAEMDDKTSDDPFWLWSKSVCR